jgi:hypothetical protein
VALSDDRVSLITRAPVSNSNSVRILVNDSLYVPPSGLESQATLFSGPGPFRIRPCFGLNGPDANSLTVSTSAGSATVNLPTGDFVTPNRILEFLRTSQVGLICLVQTKGNTLSFSDPNSSGRNSFVSVSGGAVPNLRFTQYSSRGKVLYPPWRLVAREEVYPSSSGNVVLVPARYPQFVKPIPGNPDFKVTYGSMPERCPRCQSSYVENDYRFNFAGDVVTIANEDLLYQACLKMVLTSKGSNPFHAGYGSNVMNRIGSKTTLATAASLKEDVVSALKKVQNLQNGQRKYQQVTDKERLYRVLNVDVTPSEDPTVFFISVVVSNGSGQPVSVNITYSAPGAVALAGSNGSSLGEQPTRVIVGER